MSHTFSEIIRRCGLPPLLGRSWLVCFPREKGVCYALVRESQDDGVGEIDLVEVADEGTRQVASIALSLEGVGVPTELTLEGSSGSGDTMLDQVIARIATAFEAGIVVQS